MNWRIPGAVIGSLVASFLSFAPVSASEAEKPSQDRPEWGQWEAMGSGYVARRRQPARLDDPVNQRKLPGVQVRAAALQGQAGSEEVAAVKAAARLNSSGFETVSKSAAFAVEQKVSGLWIYTTGDGLYEIPIVEIAEGLGKKEETIRRSVTAGGLRLTRGETQASQSARHPVPWFYSSASDSILFAAESYESFHSSENAYHLNVRKSPSSLAIPMQELTGESPLSAAEGIAFHETLVFEQEPDMMFLTWAVAGEPDADYWFWDMLVGGNRTAVEHVLNVPSPADGGTAQLRVTLRGFTDLVEGPEHHVSALLNGQPVGEVIFDGFEEAVLVANFDQGLLSPEGDNVLRLENSAAPGTTPGQFLDKVEIDYSRLPVSADGTLWLRATGGGLQSVSGFADEEVLVIESPASSGTIRRDVLVEPDGLGGWSVSFEARSDTEYLVAERSSAKLSALSKNYLSKLGRRRNGADYLIIAPREFSDTALALAGYRQAAYGQVEIAWLDDIYDEYSAGRRDPAALGRFMQYVVRRWQVVPRAVALLGKGTLDEKDRMGYGDSFLPVAMTANPWALASSDSRLLGFEDNPPFAIGRLPIVSDAEGLAYLDKLAAHEARVVVTESRALLVADNPDDGGNFHLNSDATATRLLDEFGFSTVDRLYHPDTGVGEALLSSDRWSTSFVSYDGHGSVTQAGNSRENFMLASQVAILANAEKPIFSALTCAVGDDSIPGTRSLAGALVLNPSGGAIAALAPTGLSLDREAQQLGNAFMSGLFLDGLPIGEAILGAKWQTDGIIQPFMQRMYSIVGEPGIYAGP